MREFRTNIPSGSGLRFVLVGILGAGLVPVLLGAAGRQHGQAVRAQALVDLKVIKLGMDSLALDFDGLYPSAATAPRMKNKAARPYYSDDFFRQLRWPEIQIHPRHLRRPVPVPAAEPAPPGKDLPPDPGNPPDLRRNEFPNPGQCAWAYVTGQSSFSRADRPLVLDPFTPGTMSFDPGRWNGEALMVRIDSSVRAEPVNEFGDVIGPDDRPLFSEMSVLWKGRDVPHVAQPRNKP